MPLFSSYMPLRPLFLRLYAVNAFIPTKNAINAAFFPVKRTPLTPVFFRLNAVNAAIFPVKRRQRAIFAVKCR